MRLIGCLRGCLTALCLLAATALADTPEAGEYELKAAMLANVVRLTEWPASKTVGAAAALTICVVNSQEMESALTRSIAKAPTAGARRLAMRKISGAADADHCEAIFFGGSERKRIEAVLRAFAAQPVLTVGESDRFTAWGGIIGLQIRDDHLQVEVNLPAANTAALSISSRLLRIAVIRGGGSS
jgi:hypothetical protein